MYLLVNPNGSKYFRLKYRFAGKEKLLPIGVYPDTSLKMAREDRDNARALLAKSIDPMLDRKIKKIANTENCFKAIALEWYGKHLANKSENYKNRVINMLERDLFPWLGDRVISEIKPSELLIALRRIESRSIQVALRSMGFSKEVMTIQGFRAMARTMIEERLKIEYKFFEHHTLHAVRDTNGRAYNRTTHLDDRHNMMQDWADYLDSLKVGAVVIPFGKNA